MELDSAPLQKIIQDSLAQAKELGMQQTQVAVIAEQGFAVTARNGDVETVEHHQEKGLSITVYDEQRSGSASTSDLSKAAVHETVAKACSIAKFTGQDEFAGIAERELLAFDYPDLDLYHHWSITPTEAIDKAIECEKIALAYDKRIKHTEGVDVSTYDTMKVIGNSHGFIGHYPRSRHAISCGVVAEQDGNMQRDFEYTTARNANAMQSLEWVAEEAAKKTVARLGSRKIKTQKCPVIFHSSMAKGLLGSFIGAISGSALYRRATFLLDQLGELVFSKHMHIFQQPHLRSAIGSAPYDAEGVRTVKQDYIRDGVLTNYVLGSYSARKLGMQSTGNAGGVFNLSLDTSDQDLLSLCQQMGTGLLVTDLMGQGVNIVTGDYSRGAAGFWIENGEIAYPVEEITIAANLKDMFANLVAVGNDVDLRGNVRTGSVLLEQMTLAGS